MKFQEITEKENSGEKKKTRKPLSLDSTETEITFFCVSVFCLLLEKSILLQTRSWSVFSIEIFPELKITACRTDSALTLKLIEITEIIMTIDEFYIDLKGPGEHLIRTEHILVYHLSTL